MNLKSSKIVSSKNLKEFFPELNEIIELSDHQIQIEYKKDLLSIIGNGNILIQKEKDQKFLSDTVFCVFCIGNNKGYGRILLATCSPNLMLHENVWIIREEFV